jgi:DNA-binding CsgD family transcriptional regulator
MLITLGVDEQMLLINRKFTEVFGYGPEQLRTAADWWPLVYPDEEYRRRVRDEWTGRIRVAIRDNTSIEPMSAEVTCADGTVRTVEGYFSHVGRVDIVTLIDMTAFTRAEEALRHQAAALADANTALRVILAQRNRECQELEQTVAHNVETMIIPILERLKRSLSRAPEAVYVDAAMQTLREITRPIAGSFDALLAADVHLTRREREIAALVRAGKSTGEIAQALYVSPATVSFHRKNLRRKLGLGAEGPLLAAHLARAPRCE